MSLNGNTRAVILQQLNRTYMNYILLVVLISSGNVISIPFDNEDLCNKGKEIVKEQSLLFFPTKGMQKNKDYFVCLKIK